MTLSIFKSGRPYYLASPYTHNSRAVMQQRFFDVAHYAGLLMKAGVYVYCPILMTHPAAMLHDLPVEFEWWDGFNRAFLKESEGVIVANMDGWRHSRGVQHEIKLAIELGLSVHLMYDDGKIQGINSWA